MLNVIFRNQFVDDVEIVLGKDFVIEIDDQFAIRFFLRQIAAFDRNWSRSGSIGLSAAKEAVEAASMAAVRMVENAFFMGKDTPGLCLQRRVL